MFTKTKDAMAVCEEDIFCGVNTVSDISLASDLEKKHLPIITAPKKVKKGEYFDVTIEVGKLLGHPSEPGHFIMFIELYSGDTYIARLNLTPQTTVPVMKVRIALDHGHSKLRAFERCNLHGTWEYDTDIEVVE